MASFMLLLKSPPPLRWLPRSYSTANTSFPGWSHLEEVPAPLSEGRPGASDTHPEASSFDGGENRPTVVASESRSAREGQVALQPLIPGEDPLQLSVRTRFSLLPGVPARLDAVELFHPRVTRMVQGRPLPRKRCHPHRAEGPAGECHLTGEDIFALDKDDRPLISCHILACLGCNRRNESADRPNPLGADPTGRTGGDGRRMSETLKLEPRIVIDVNGGIPAVSILTGTPPESDRGRVDPLRTFPLPA